jgi:hypothetical protein
MEAIKQVEKQNRDITSSINYASEFSKPCFQPTIRWLP